MPAGEPIGRAPGRFFCAEGSPPRCACDRGRLSDGPGVSAALVRIHGLGLWRRSRDAEAARAAAVAAPRVVADDNARGAHPG